MPILKSVYVSGFFTVTTILPYIYVHVCTYIAIYVVPTATFIK